jgi:hypothetical protein
MERTHADLFVRQHLRRTCDHGARLSVAPQASAAVVFARGVADGAGAVEARIVDFSAGGVGLGVGTFLPRGCPLRLCLVDAAPGIGPVSLVVRRVQMTDSTPRYYVGAAFDESSSGATAAVRTLLNHLGSVTPPAGAPP